MIVPPYNNMPYGRGIAFSLSLVQYTASKMAAMATAVTATSKTTRVMQTASRGVEAADAGKRETVTLGIGSWKGCYTLGTPYLYTYYILKHYYGLIGSLALLSSGPQLL